MGRRRERGAGKLDELSASVWSAWEPGGAHWQHINRFVLKLRSFSPLSSDVGPALACSSLGRAGLSLPKRPRQQSLNGTRPAREEGNGKPSTAKVGTGRAGEEGRGVEGQEGPAPAATTPCIQLQRAGVSLPAFSLPGVLRVACCRSSFGRAWRAWRGQGSLTLAANHCSSHSQKSPVPVSASPSLPATANTWRNPSPVADTRCL